MRNANICPVILIAGELLMSFYHWVSGYTNLRIAFSDFLVCLVISIVSVREFIRFLVFLFQIFITLLSFRSMTKKKPFLTIIYTT